MEMTLDESLAEIDKWKAAAVDQIADLTPGARAKVGREAIAWLEREIGRPLKRVPILESDTATTG